ncbi:hypothetical protein BC826DRAFT_628720 [Russula brevipes]|nr:hypothetical protein BC826DRAFT_628720 [Russula brevipes]
MYKRMMCPHSTAPGFGFKAVLSPFYLLCLLLPGTNFNPICTARGFKFVQRGKLKPGGNCSEEEFLLGERGVSKVRRLEGAWHA